MSNPIHTLLIFPPFWEPSQPYLALPALTAYLKQQECSVRQWDLNLDFHDTLISTAYLSKMVTQYARDVARFIPLAEVQAFLPQVDTAKAVLRSPDFFVPEKFIQAKNTIEKAYQLYSIFYYPTQCSKRAFLMPFRESSSEDILKAVQHDSNPYRAYYAEQVLPRIQSENPQLIGISIADTTQLIGGLTLSYMIKHTFPDIHITFGGALFSKFAQALQDKPSPAFDVFLDSMITGEGEKALWSLVQALEGQMTLAEVPALVYRDASGQVMMNDKGEPVPMGALPTPDFSDLPLEKYWVPEPILPLLGSKDCYWKDCAFCDHYVSYAPRYRLRRPHTIAEDMEQLYQIYGVTQFSFGDETMSPNYARHLSQSLIDKGRDFQWSMLSRLQKGFDKDTCELLKKGGCTFVMYGLESANARVIELMAKGTEMSQALEVYQNTDAAGIYNYSFVFFGFPTETRTEAQQTVDFILENHEILHSLGAGYFYLQKFSPLFKDPQKYGIYALNDQDLADDWTISVRYDLLEGMTQPEAAAFHQGFMEQLKSVYGMPLWLVDNARSTLFLYINHHGKEWMTSYDYQGKVQVHVTG